jgi:hypothetical protein
MTETKYGKYVVTNPLKFKPNTGLAHHTPRRDKGYLEAGSRPGEGKFLPQDTLPDCQVRCMVSRQLGVPDPQPFIDAHSHAADEVIMFLSMTPDGTLGAEVEIEMGDEGEKHAFDKTTVIYVPAGLTHAPIWYRNFEEGRVFYMITLLLRPDYD